MDKEFKRIHGGWKNVPPKMKTKTQLNELGLKPTGKPIGEVWSYKNWIPLYSENETVPKRKSTPAQLKALEKARAKAQENKTCERCKEVQSHKKDIYDHQKERLCSFCYTVKMEEEERYKFQAEKEHFTRVAGVSYDGRQEHIKNMTEKTELTLEREPNNQYDQSAVKVLARISDEWHQIGYLHREFAAKTAKIMDTGGVAAAEMERIEEETYENETGWFNGSDDEFVSFLRVYIRLFFV